MVGGVVQGENLLQVSAGRIELPQAEQGAAESAVQRPLALKADSGESDMVDRRPAAERLQPRRLLPYDPATPFHRRLGP